jgi:ssDNA-binding Zn-finger/Zn-ribbon topoisomerase 1
MRQYIEWGHMGEIESKLGIKRKPAKEKEVDKTKKREKFAKCKQCGGQMTYVPGTNILVCENEVEKKMKRTLEDGSTIEEIKTTRCGNTNLISDNFMGYFEFLFKEEN